MRRKIFLPVTAAIRRATTIVVLALPFCISCWGTPDRRIFFLDCRVTGTVVDAADGTPRAPPAFSILVARTKDTPGCMESYGDKGVVLSPDVSEITGNRFTLDEFIGRGGDLPRFPPQFFLTLQSCPDSFNNVMQPIPFVPAERGMPCHDFGEIRVQVK